MKELRTLQQESAYRDATGHGARLSVLINTHRLPTPAAEPEPEPEPQPEPQRTKKAINLPPFVAHQIDEYKRSLPQVGNRSNPNLRYHPRQPEPRA